MSFTSSRSPLPAPSVQVNCNRYWLPSPQTSPETSPCPSSRTTLSKGATFHASSSSPSDGSPVLSIRHLTRRSPTSSQASLTDLVFGKQDDAARSIENLERTFSAVRVQHPARRRGTTHCSLKPSGLPPSPPLSDDGTVSPRVLPGAKNPSLCRERPFGSDSGLGSSIVSDLVKSNGVRTSASASKEGSPQVAHSVQDIVDTLPHRPDSESKSQFRSVGPISAFIPPTTQQPSLSKFARNKFVESIFQPILQDERFRLFHPLATTLGSRTNKSIKCLRDLEQSLILEPLRLAVSSSLYRAFGEFSVQLVLDTFHHLSEIEQRRSSDRPYDSGYFLDLVQQVGRLAARANPAGHSNGTGDSANAVPDVMDYSPEDEITLEGGLGQTGQPAELVRWRNGEGISLRTSERYELQPGVKRQRSNGSFDDVAARSMGRRRKNAEVGNTEYRCSESQCGKTFKRPCDLSKHEKTHSRPFKCPVEGCRYHWEGLAGEKERDRHVNDKHSANPHYYHCHHCDFKTKRDSNCKQHMEKKHGIAYSRTKGTSKAKASAQHTPQTPTQSTPSSSEMGPGSTNDSDFNMTPHTTSSLEMSVDSGGAAQTRDPYAHRLFAPPSFAGLPFVPAPDWNSDPRHTPDHSPASPANAGSHPSSAQLDSIPPWTPDNDVAQGHDMTSLDPLHMLLDYQGSGLDFNNPALSLSAVPSFSPMMPQPSGYTRSDIPRPVPDDAAAFLDDMAGLPSDDFSLFTVPGEAGVAAPTPGSQHQGPMDMFGDLDREYSDSQLGRYVNF